MSSSCDLKLQLFKSSIISESVLTNVDLLNPFFCTGGAMVNALIFLLEGPGFKPGIRRRPFVNGDLS